MKLYNSLIKPENFTLNTNCDMCLFWSISARARPSETLKSVRNIMEKCQGMITWTDAWGAQVCFSHNLKSVTGKLSMACEELVNHTGLITRLHISQTLPHMQFKAKQLSDQQYSTTLSLGDLQ